ncbi:MAG: DUF6788 family protein [Desulfobaccales bacterium]
MDLSSLRSHVLDLAKDRSDLEARLLMHEQFTKGSLVYLRTRCGKPNCRCRKSKRHRHGPRLYLSVSRDGRQRMVYVPKALMEQTRRLVEQARSFRAARKKWRSINQDLWNIFMKMERLKTRPMPHEPKRKGR